jgi:hypothetical protein
MTLDAVVNNAHRFYDGNLGLSMVWHCEPPHPFCDPFVLLFPTKLLACIRNLKFHSQLSKSLKQ